MKISIRKAKPDDMVSVHGLICELAEYEKALQEVTNTVDDMIRDGFGEPPVFHCLVAERDNKIIGMAIYFIKYSTWKGKGIYLDDIVVTESMRGKRVGKLLFDEVISQSLDMGANQLHWQVLDWNQPAIHFYNKYKAMMDSEWINCKLSRFQMKKLAEENKGQ